MRIFFIYLVFIFTTLLSFSQEKKTTTIYFDMDEDTISIKNQLIIDTIIKINYISEIEITAYTDFVSTKDYNQKLSKRRSKSVYNYLIKKGISKSKIKKCIGLGVYPNSNFNQRNDSNDAGVAAHRRAEIRYCLNAINQDTTSNNDSITPLFFNEEELKIGDKIVLENIFFYSGTPLFKPESEKTLKQLLEIMQNHPSLEIEIQGHICCKFDGEDGYDHVNNDNHLSLNRAKAVYTYLVVSGIAANRIKYKGFGSSNKRFPFERTTEEEDLNRRVEIMILKK